MRSVAICLVGTALACGGGSAFAAYLTYFGQDLDNSTTPITSIPISSAAEAAFRSVVVGEGVETFEGQPTGATGPLAVTISTAAGPVTATLSGGGGVVAAVTPGTAEFGRYSIPSGTSSKYWSADAATGDFFVRFSEAVTAFGFYGVDIGDFDGQLALDLLRADDSVISSLTIPHAPGSQGSTDGSVLFYGLLGESAANDFYGVRFRMTDAAPTDLSAFDNFTVAMRSPNVSPVSEPSSLALLACGLVTAGCARRRRA